MKFDPEIDPSIREAQEAAEREREMSARIRLEIERYVQENDLVPRRDDDTEEEIADGDKPADEAEAETKQNDTPEEPAPKSRRQLKREEKEAKREADKAKKARRAESTRKAFQSVFTGSIIENEQIRRLMPYLAGLALLMLLYIANVFHLQRLHRTQQRLEEDIRELSIKAVGFSAERAQQTKRSAIVRQLEEKNIPLREYPYPLKTIDPK